MTSRWVVDVAPRREVGVRWRTYSLAIKNEGADIPERYRAPAEVSLGALRVVEAVWADEGDEPVGRLYTALGEQFHHRGDISVGAVGEALKACGLSPERISAAEDERWDAEIRGSMADARSLVGDDVGVPILAFHDGDEVHGVSGPVMAPLPTGDGALQLWDHVVGVSRCPSFFELKRGRNASPRFDSTAS